MNEATDWGQMYNELGFWIERLDVLQDLAIEMDSPEQDTGYLDDAIKELIERTGEDDYVLEFHDSRMPVKGRLRLIWEVVDYTDEPGEAES